ncbi:MAG: aldo/keto reductase [Candidatus Bathyarchaeia archaeon]
MPERATAEGTKRFRERHEAKGYVSSNHFRVFSKLHLSSLGVGTYLGEPTAETDLQVKEAVKASIRSGAVNVVDTAINYRFQKAERSVGAAIRELISQGEITREEVFIATKNGYLTPDGDLRIHPTEYIMDQLVKPGIIRAEDVAQGIHCMSALPPGPATTKPEEPSTRLHRPHVSTQRSGISNPRDWIRRLHAASTESLRLLRKATPSRQNRPLWFSHMELLPHSPR